MAFIPKSGITTGGTIQASHVVNIIESLDGTGSYQITATGSFSGSFVGNGAGITGIAAAINTGSFAITGSNTFIGNQIISGSTRITGSLNVTGSITVLDGAYTNFTTQSVPLTIQTGYNALLVGPLFNSSSITIQAGARLVIL